MRTLSNGLRKPVIDAVEGGMSRGAAAARFGVRSRPRYVWWKDLTMAGIAAL